jgi:penicillin-binding protein 1A
MVLRVFLALFFVGTIAVIWWVGHLYYSIRGEAELIKSYEMELSSEVFDRNGKKISNLVGREYRFYAEFDEIPAKVVEALLAIEDTVFFEHNGINVEAIIRAIFKDIKAMGMVEGASTITQQLVRNTILTREKTLIRKLKEVLLSLRVEEIISKEEILELYLNKIYYGRGFYGIKTAAKGYFRKELNALSLKEIAMLIGLIKAPSFYDPTKNYDHSIGRANRVLRRMYSGLGWITRKEYEKAVAEEPEVFSDSKTQNVAPYIVDYVIKKLSKNFDDLRTGGYKIYTTIDLDIQNLAKESLIEGHKRISQRLQKAGYRDTRIDKLNGAMVSIDPHSGDILAMVGGVNYRSSSFNRATQGVRQIGSSVKPFIYQIALDLGYSGASILNDVQRTYNYTDKYGIKRKWQPQNYSKKVKGRVKLRDALIHSKNLATINLVTDIGLNNIYRELMLYGFDNIPRDLSISLGSFGMSILELSKMYTLFSNYGTIVEPTLIKQVVNKHLDKQSVPIAERFVTKSRQAYLMVNILRDVVLRGSGRRAYIRGLDIAGKTGTTNGGVDVWFTGFTPEYQTIVWFGNDDNTPISKKASGGSYASPVLKDFYSGLLKLKPQMKRRFWRPKGVDKIKFEGKWEVFTDISRPPAVNSEKSVITETPLLF